MTAREIARAALDLADEALALAERKDSCTGGQRRALADLEFEYAIGIFQTTNPECDFPTVKFCCTGRLTFMC